ncbi:MAG: nucleoside triphosphate pyrophosphohydrolase [Sphingomonadales bacterium]
MTAADRQNPARQSPCAKSAHASKPKDASQALSALLALMARLRDPNGGCPWDRAQNFQSIAPYTIEEAYEVADAIARDAMTDLRDELGDLLFQVVFHARMAEEAGLFDFAEVACALVDKMTRRHPHVFGGAAASGEDGQPAAWEAIKERERAQKAALQGQTAPPSAVDGVPVALPALTRAEKLQKRAARQGFDWPKADPGIRAKIEEELTELDQAVGQESNERQAEEFGDVLFACVNLGRHLGLDAETALRRANDKFERRFRHMEAAAAANGDDMKAMSLDQLEALWQAAKQL